MDRKKWLILLSTASAPILGMALVYAVSKLLGFGERDFRNLLINVGFLSVGMGLIWSLKLSRRDVGLEIVKDRIWFHVVAGSLILALYLWFYIFVIQISHLKPFTGQVGWTLCNYLVVAFAEEIYFRGILYAIVQRYFSPRMALLISSLFFGLMHIQQGIFSVLDKLIAGWLWGTVRYSTGMIFLLIIPIHFLYNSVWLLFAGNWENPPFWAYFFPLAEILLGAGILLISSRWPQLSDIEE